MLVRSPVPFVCWTTWRKAREVLPPFCSPGRCSLPRTAVFFDSKRERWQRNSADVGERDDYKNGMYIHTTRALWLSCSFILCSET
eukprot:s48_g44.t1